MEPYKPRAFRFIELVDLVNGRCNSTGLRTRANFHELNYWLRQKKSRRLSWRNLSRMNFTSDLLAYTMDAMRRLSLSISGETRTSFFTAYFFPGGDKFADLSPAGDSDPSVCVWDLALQSFERAAWIKHVLLKADAPDFAGYLSDRRNFDL
jgi:hypothetical protein